MKRFALVCIALLLASDVATAAGSSFGNPYRLTRDWMSTFHVAIGDVDGDGRHDLVASSRNAPAWDFRMAFFLQRQDGTLAPPLEVPLPENIVGDYRIALADLDGDGVVEAVAGRSETGLHVFKMSPSGTVSMAEHPGPAVNCKFVAAADIDLDGNMDVVCHNEQLSAAVYLGNGNGGFRSSYQFRTLAGWYVVEYDFKSIQLADVTGDGYPDLLISAGHSSAFHVLANNRMGGFLPGYAYPHPNTVEGALLPSVVVHAVDMDGDGVHEVLTATPNNRPDATLNVYRRASNGFLQLAERIPVHDAPTAIATGLVGGNAGVDVVLGHYTFNAASVLGEDGGGLHTQFVYELPGFGNHIDLGDARKQYSIALGDLDGDGCNDLGAATWSGVMILYGCEASSTSIPVSDFDGDGLSDLLWDYPVAPEQHLWQQADQRLWYLCRFPYPCPDLLRRRMVGQAIGDFDGDGNSDVFWRSREDGSNELRLGAFYSRHLTAVTDQGWQVVGAGDFDGDDRSDLLWRHATRGTNAIWRSADYRSQLAIASVTDVRWQVAGIGDMDGDGRSDIVWRHAATGRNAIWGSGRLDRQIAMTAVTNTDWRIRGIGDFNRDGRDDVVWRNARTGANVIWLSGDSRTQQSVTGVTNPDWDIVGVGDYNGDGTSDLVWRNGRTGVNAIWLSGRFQTQQVVAPIDTFFSLIR